MKGKTLSYFKYALGEIVLVVIGILIALQINNWNEAHKRKQLEIEILKEIRSDLIESSDELDSAIAFHKQFLLYGKKLVDHILNKRPLSDSVYSLYTRHMTDYELIQKTSGYENLNNLGLNIIENDSLRKIITDYYMMEIPRVLKIYNEFYEIEEKGMTNHFYYLQVDLNETKTYSYKYADTLIVNKADALLLNNGDKLKASKGDTIKVSKSETLTVNKWRMKNYEELLVDSEFMRLAQNLLYIRTLKIELLYESNQKVIQLIDQINKEIN